MDLFYMQKKSPVRGYFVILILKQVQDDVSESIYSYPEGLSGAGLLLQQ